MIAGSRAPAIVDRAYPAPVSQQVASARVVGIDQYVNAEAIALENQQQWRGEDNIADARREVNKYGVAGQPAHRSGSKT